MVDLSPPHIDRLNQDSPTGTIIFAVHMDNIIVTASSAEENARFSEFLKSKWQITELGEPKLALSITISCDRANHTITLSSTPKINELIEEYGQADMAKYSSLWPGQARLAASHHDVPIHCF
jgi:hypothetical protein